MKLEEIEILSDRLLDGKVTTVRVDLELLSISKALNVYIVYNHEDKSLHTYDTPEELISRNELHTDFASLLNRI